jgi:hypothetical protein
MTRKPLEFISGLAVFLVLWVGVMSAVRFHLLVPRPLLVWLSQSPNPQQALLSFGALVGIIIVALLRLGIEIPVLKPITSSDRVRAYLAGLPFWAVGTIFAISLAGLLIVFPSCQPPASVVFDVGGNTLHPSDVLAVKPGDSVTIAVKPIQDDVILSCEWQYAGDAFEMLGANNGCEINIEFARRPGEGFLTLLASQDFCRQSSVFSLRVQVNAP